MSYLPNITGWIPITLSCAFGSATASPNFTMTITDSNAYIPNVVGLGDRVTCTNQSTTQYFIVVKIAASAGTTTLTLFGGANYSLASGSVTNVYFSHMKSPFGFNPDPSIWLVSAIGTGLCTKASPAAGTYYGDTDFTGNNAPKLSIPIGAWLLQFEGCLEATMTSGNAIQATMTLGSAHNTVYDTDYNYFQYLNAGTVQATTAIGSKSVVMSSATTIYLIAAINSGTASNLYMNMAGGQLKITATSNYV